MQLGSHMAMASRCSSNSTPSLETSIHREYGPKKQKEGRKEERKEGRKEGRKRKGKERKGRKNEVDLEVLAWKEHQDTNE